MTARQAVAAGICPAEQMPGSQRVLVIDSRRIVVAWDLDQGDELVTAAYLLMRMSAAHHDRSDAVSTAEMDQHVRAIAASLSPLDDILRQATACRRSAEKIHDTAKSLREALAERMGAVQARLSEAA